MHSLKYIILLISHDINIDFGTFMRVACVVTFEPTDFALSGTVGAFH